MSRSRSRYPRSSPPTPPRPRSRRLLVGGLLTAAVVGASAAPAFAHVTVRADSTAVGSSSVLTFRMPNERDNTPTTKLEVQLPDNPVIVSARPDVRPGWTTTVETRKLSKPVKSVSGGTVSEVPSKITWQAGDAKRDGIPPNTYADFHVSIRGLPNAPSLTFKALQTYGSGEVVRWIELQQPGQPTPDHPAPVLKLTPASSSASSGGGTAAAPASSDSGSDTLARVLSIVALVVAVLFGAGGFLLGSRRQSATRATPAGPSSATEATEVSKA